MGKHRRLLHSRKIGEEMKELIKNFNRTIQNKEQLWEDGMKLSEAGLFVAGRIMRATSLGYLPISAEKIMIFLRSKFEEKYNVTYKVSINYKI